MFINIIDKITFAFLLLCAFQVPILSDHYLQYVNGYYQATKVQVDGFAENAKKHQYPSVEAMVADLLKNANSVVRTDAKQKQQTLLEFNTLNQALITLQNGNIFERAWFMFQPSRFHTLKQVTQNFKPGIPLAINELIYALILSLILSMLLLSPVRYLFRKRDKAATTNKPKKIEVAITDKQPISPKTSQNLK